MFNLIPIRSRTSSSSRLTDDVVATTTTTTTTTTRRRRRVRRRRSNARQWACCSSRARRRPDPRAAARRRHARRYALATTTTRGEVARGDADVVIGNAGEARADVAARSGGDGAAVRASRSGRSRRVRSIVGRRRDGFREIEVGAMTPVCLGNASDVRGVPELLDDDPETKVGVVSDCGAVAGQDQEGARGRRDDSMMG